MKEQNVDIAQEIWYFRSQIIGLLKSAALLAVALITAAVGAAFVQPMAAQIEYSPEEYLAQGKTTGCGISFLTVWAGDDGEAIGVSALMND